MNKTLLRNKKGWHQFRSQFTGIVFMVPFIIGFVFLFAKPMVVSIIYSFSSMTINAGSVDLQWVGLENYVQLINDISFLKIVWAEAQSFLWKIPMILVFSMFVALLLKDKFPGRLLFRCIVFMPVIFASDLIMGLLKRNSTISLSTSDNIYMLANGEAAGFMQDLLSAFGFGESFSESLSYYIGQIFTISWASGIQIVLFIIGLSAVPAELYEVCDMEGATKWETFWKITFPLLSPTILLCVVYTIIATFNSNSNSIMTRIAETMQYKIPYACVQTWAYSLMIMLIIGVVYWAISRWTVYLD